MLRLGALLAMGLAALIAGVAPAAAVFNWDYACKAADEQLSLDVTAIFAAGSAGPVRVHSLIAAVKPSNDAAADPGFTAEDVEQFWAGKEEYLLSLVRYVGEEPSAARLTFNTTCKDHQCTGSYRYERGETELEGSVTCEQSDAG